MALKKKKKFRFTFGVFIRLVVFFVFTYLAINYLSSNKRSDPTVLGDETTNIDLKPYTDKVYQLIPSKSRSQIENLPKSAVIIQIQEKIDEILPQAKDFPQNQIKAIQKWIVTSVSNDLIKKIENTK